MVGTMANQKRSNRSKKAVNVSIDATLLAEAKEFGTNVSSVLERALKLELKTHRMNKWREANRAAIEEHNKFIKKHGLLSDDWRKF